MWRILLRDANVKPKQDPSLDYFEEQCLLHPELSTIQDDCDWFKETTPDRLFSYTGMLCGIARPSSAALWSGNTRLVYSSRR